MADFEIAVHNVFAVFVFIADFYMDTAVGVLKIQSVVIGAEMGIGFLVKGA